MKKLLPLLALLAFAAGCLGTTSNNFFFSYDVDRLENPPAAAPGVQVTNDVSGILAVEYGTTTPCFTDQIELNGNRSGEVLTLRVVRRPQPGACTDNRTRHFRYQAVFSGMRLGTYTLRIIDETSGTPTTVYDQQVTLR
jgi:hypothetical protein